MADGIKTLRGVGQSLWLDNITRGMLDDGTLARYIDELSVTGLTSNPAIYNRGGQEHPLLRRRDRREGAGRDRGRAALLRTRARGPHPRRRPLPAGARPDRRARRLGVARGLAHARLRHRAARSPPPATCTPAPAARTCSSRFPGTPAGLPAIEEAIFAGVPVNVTLLFTTRAVPRRGRGLPAGRRAAHRGGALAAGLLGGVAVHQPLGRRHGRHGCRPPSPTGSASPIGQQAYRAYRDLLASDRFQRLANFGALPQRLLFASTGTKDPRRSDTLYVAALAAPHTVNTMPEPTLLAFADHGSRRRHPLGRAVAPPRRRSSPSAAPASTSTRWARSCRRTGPRPS